MRHYHAPILLAAILATGQLTSCTDDNYDLSDLDTTTRVNVNDLVIPINLTDIRMESIIKPDGLLQVVNDQYCIVKDADKEPGEQYAFSSDEIRIDDVTLEVENINPTKKEFDVPELPDIPIGQIPPDLEDLSFSLASDLSPLNIGATGVPNEISDINEIGTHLMISFKISLTGFGDDQLNGFQIKDLKLQLPKGLDNVNDFENKYDRSTGILTVKDQRIEGNSKTMYLSCDRIKVGTPEKPAPTGITFDKEKHEITYNGKLGVIDGEAIIKVKEDIKGLQNLKEIPSTIYYNVDYSVEPIPVKTFSGGLVYEVPDIEIPEIPLDDIDKVLKQPGTDISLENPQIYLSLNNPIVSNFPEDKQNESVGSLGLKIKAKHQRANGSYKYTDYTMNDRIEIMPEDQVKYVLSPSDKGLLPPEGFKDATHVDYKDLGKILSGTDEHLGLPLSLTVEPMSPTIDTSEVVDLKLGENLGKFTGDYYLIAPLQLAEGSTIFYSGTSKGWGDGDLEDLTVNTLEVSANVTTDIPVGIILSMEPINSKGDVIRTENPVSVKVSANAKSELVTIELKGDINDLDGVRYKATATAAQSDQSLSENMTIALKQIRATVSGYYTTDF